MDLSFRKSLLAGSACMVLGSLALIGSVGEVRAADVTPSQAAALEGQVKEWVSGLLGIPVTGPVQITAAGDHFDLTSSTIYRKADGVTPARATATARQQDDGTWSIDHAKLDTPLQFTLNVPTPPGQASDPKLPGTSQRTTYVIDLKGQDGHIAWDPSFTKPSEFVSSVQGVTVHVDGGPIGQESTIGPIQSMISLRPAGPDRVDVKLDGTIQDYRIQAQTENGPLQMVMGRVLVKSAMNGVSRGRAVTILQTLAAFGATAMNAPAMAGQPSATPPKLSPEAVRALLGALQDFASDFSLDETLDGLTVNAQGVDVGIEQLKIGMTARSATGMLDAGLDLGMQGLTLPGLPLGDMAALIPKRVALHPVISGISVAELMRLATTASEKRDPAPEDIAALFSHGGITGGLDSMTVEVGGAVFTGRGKVVATAPSPDAIAGTAHIEAAGLDDLIQKMSAMPAMAQALPVLALAKGLGKVVDNRVVWDLVYKDGKALVNNVDLSAMGGSSAPPAAAVVPPSVRQPQPDTNSRNGARKAPIPSQIPSWGR